MGHLVAAIVGWAHRQRTIVVAIVALGLIVSIEGTRRLSFDTDVLSLLPRDSRVIQAFRSFLSRFGSLDQLYVICTAPEGHAISEYSDDIDAWVAELRAAPEIVRVDAGTVDRTRSFEWLADRQLLILHDRYLDEALRRLSADHMSAAIAARRDLLAFPGADVAQVVRQDPAALFDLLRDAVGGSTPGGLMMGLNDGGYVTADGRSRLLIARPRRPPFDVEFSQALDARLREITGATARRAAQARENGDEEPRPAMQVQFAGGHRIAVETEAVVKSESIWNTVGSLIVILPLLYFVFRSVWLVTVGSLPSGLSLVFVLGALGFTGAKLSAAATGAAAMLFGLGVDGVVLLYVAHRLAVADGVSDIPAALEGPSSSMLLGMWTTAATFYGLMFVDFPSLEQLGRLLGHSMVVCGVLTLVMVPALLPRRAPRRPVPALLMPRFAAWMVSRRRAVLVGSVLVTVVLGYGGDADPRQPDARSPAIGDQRGPDRNRDRTEVRPSERCLRGARRRPRTRAAAAGQRTPRTTADGGHPGSGVPVAGAPAALGRRAGTSVRRRSREAVCRLTRFDRRSNGHGWRTTSRRARSSRSRRACRASSTPTSGSPSTGSSPTTSAISSIGSSSTNPAAGRWRRICFRRTRARPRACRTS